MSRLARRIFAAAPQPTLTRLRNRELYRWMNVAAPGAIVLNLGSGVGRFDRHLAAGVRMINLDRNPAAPGVHVVADAHRLPFADASVDIVYSIAVLEHLERPWVVADEIARVVRPGGHVALEAPLLNVIHDERDYFRFTDRGLRSLFDAGRWEPVLEQVGSGGGSFLSAFLFIYLREFVPTRPLRAAWDLGMGHLLGLLRFADALVDSSPTLRLTANSFTLIARRRG